VANPKNQYAVAHDAISNGVIVRGQQFPHVSSRGTAASPGKVFQTVSLGEQTIGNIPCRARIEGIQIFEGACDVVQRRLSPNDPHLRGARWGLPFASRQFQEPLANPLVRHDAASRNGGLSLRVETGSFGFVFGLDV
jgi:hypothetical protein